MSRPSVSDARVSRAEKAAQGALKRLGLAHPAGFDLAELVWVLRPKLLVRDANLQGSIGRLTRQGSAGIITVSDTVWYPPRRRFVIAHELGHFELHDETNNQLALCTEADAGEQEDAHARMPVTEREANVFATELLMPKAIWEKRAEVRKPSVEIVRSLSDDFEVSFAAAMFRFVRLTPERCAAVWAREGRIERVASSPDFGHFIESQTKLSKFSNANDYFLGRACSKTQDLVPASAWLQRVGKDDDIYEQVVVIESLKSTVSLLWIPSDAEF
mgnify:CR=1 FL=1